MTYFITGGNGHLGYWLIKRLAEEGNRIHALVRDPDKSGHLLFGGVTLFKGDITDPASIHHAMKGCERVYHLAALAKIWDKDPGNFQKINVDGTIHIFEAATRLGVKKVVHCSSAGSFGPSNDGIISETKQRKIPFFNAYERTKAEADAIVMRYQSPDLEVCIVSPSRIFGPVANRKPEAVSLLIWNYLFKKWRIIPGNGRQIGNYAFTGDVVNGHLLAMEHGKSGENYLLGGENISFDMFFQVLAEVSGIKRRMIHVPYVVLKLITYLQMLKPYFGKEPALTPDWTAKVKLDWALDISKAEHELGYSTTPFSIAMKETVDYFIASSKAKL